jgi:hypothetical protein
VHKNHKPFNNPIKEAVFELLLYCSLNIETYMGSKTMGRVEMLSKPKDSIKFRNIDGGK